MDKVFLKKGLTTLEVQKRLVKFGRNELVKKQEFTEAKLLLFQFKSPLVYILVLAGITTLFLKEWTDAVVIFAAVILNTVLGFYQERKAQKALEALRLLLAPKTKVIRDGETKEVETSELVPGDLVVLTIGNRVPADGLLARATDLSLEEAILTGESMPVEKVKSKILKVKTTVENLKMEDFRKESQVFMGTTVSTGIAKMIVTQTGMNTEMGKIGKSLEAIDEEKTPLQIQLARLAKVLALLVGAIALIIFLFGIYKKHLFVEMFTTSVAVAVAAIPEGLVVTLTVILALGMQRILKRKALVRKLLAAETLGSVSTICADKTGTLTEGKMKAVKAVTRVAKRIHLRGGPGRPPREKEKEAWLVKAAVLCNDMRDPLEVGMLDFAKQKLSSEEIEKLKRENPRIDEVPFSPKYKYIATLHHAQRGSGQAFGGVLFVSGAPEVVLSMSNIKSEELKKDWLKKFNELGGRGYRLVGFAYKNVKSKNLKVKIKTKDLKDFEWLGVLAYEDPVRKGVRSALSECQRAGIKVKVITGDYASTAQAVLGQLEIFGKPGEFGVMEGSELAEISEAQLAKKLDEVVLFARSTPEQKLKIVEAIKNKGEVVAMTGDGVNDAPALAKADIGIVVGGASDVAKQTAEMVLLDSNFATIVAAIKEGRTIFENIKKVVLYLLSDSFSEVILISGALFMGLPLPVTAAQILWINLIEDSLPSISLAFEPGEKGLMNEPPRPRKAAILTRELKILIFTIGILTDFFLLAIFFWLSRVYSDIAFIRTVIFVGLGFDSLFFVLSCRSLRKPFFKFNLFSNRLLTATIILGIILLVFAVYFPPLQTLLKTRPLNWQAWVLLLLLGIVNFFAIEVAKWFFILRKRKVDPRSEAIKMV